MTKIQQVLLSCDFDEGANSTRSFTNQGVYKALLLQGWNDGDDLVRAYIGRLRDEGSVWYINEPGGPMRLTREGKKRIKDLRADTPRGE